jgi:hypothetical protein
MTKKRSLEPGTVLPQTQGQMSLFGLMMIRSRNVYATVEAFGHISTLIAALGERVDREAVYRALAFGVLLCSETEALEPAWTKDRDEAYRRVDDAVQSLKRVLGRDHRGLDHETEDLEGALGRLTEGGPLSSNLLRRGADASELRPTTKRGGRPRDEWRAATIGHLRAAHVPLDDAEALLTAANLTRPRRE